MAPPTSTYTSLPPELLVDIFSDIEAPPELMTLALVCRSWKEIVYGEHSLWTTLDVTKYTPPAQVHAQLERCGNAELDLTLSFPPRWDYGAFEDVLVALLAEKNRIRTLYIEAGIMHDGGDENYDDEDRWPLSLEAALSDGAAWPHLRELDISNSLRGDILYITISAPNLVTMELRHVSVRDWGRLNLGTSFRELAITTATSSDMHGLALVLANCPRLRELYLVTYTGRNETFVFKLPGGQSPVFLDLVDIEVKWPAPADLSSCLHLIECCPNLERLVLWATDFVGQNVAMLSDSRFKLPRLGELTLRATPNDPRLQAYGPPSDLLDLLAPALSASQLKELQLDNMHLMSLEGLLGSHLEYLGLGSVVYDPQTLASCLQRCTNLTTLHLGNFEMSSLDAVWSGDVRLPHLERASMHALGLNDRLQTISASDRIAHNGRLVDFFLSLVDSPGIASIGVTYVNMTDEQMLRFLRELGDGGKPLRLDIRHSDSDAAELWIPGYIFSTEDQRLDRRFEVSMLAHALRTLQSTYAFFDRIKGLTIDKRHLEEFFDALLSLTHPRLLLLSSLKISPRYSNQRRADRLDATLDAVADLCAGRQRTIEAPRLHTVTLNGSASSAARARFIALFKTGTNPHVMQYH